MKSDEGGKFCSFCGTPGNEVAMLAGGLGAFICDQCVGYYGRIFAARAADGENHQEAVPPWQSMTDVELLAQLPRISASGDQADDFLVEWVDLCRTRGCSWSVIGQALGTTRQTAWEKFHRKLDALHRTRDLAVAD